MKQQATILNLKTPYKGKWLSVTEEEIIKPDGTQAMHEVVHRNNGVLVIAQKDDTFLLVSM